MEFFKHYINASDDDKLCSMLSSDGYEMLGYYWRFIEYLYGRGGTVSRDRIPSIAWSLHMDKDKLERLITGFDLFVVDEESVSSKRVLAEIHDFEAVGKRMSELGKAGGKASAKAKAQPYAQAGGKRTVKRTVDDSSSETQADVKRTLNHGSSEGQAYAQQNKIKENKRKEKKNIYCVFFDSVWDLYPSKKGKTAVTNKALKEMQEAGEDVVRAALQQYISTKPDWQHWMNGSTFFNGRWRDYVGESSPGTEMRDKPKKPFDEFIPDGIAQGSEEEYMLVSGKRYNRWGQELNEAGYPIIDFGLSRFGNDF